MRICTLHRIVAALAVPIAFGATLPEARAQEDAQEDPLNAPEAQPRESDPEEEPRPKEERGHDAHPSETPHIAPPPIVSVTANTHIGQPPVEARKAKPSSRKAGTSGPDAAEKAEERAEFEFFSHGFRLGYLYMVNHECKQPGSDAPDSSCVDVAAKYDVKRPHFFLIGYELMQRVEGNSWLNVFFVENIMIGGIEQSLFLPSMNNLIGFELFKQLQIGVGVNLLPVSQKPAHLITAVGWTPKAGNINIPVHFAFIPDVDKQHRLSSTIGVNW